MVLVGSVGHQQYITKLQASCTIIFLGLEKWIMFVSLLKFCRPPFARKKKDFCLGLLPADVHRSNAAGQTGVFHAAAAHCVLSVRGRGEGVRDLAVHEEDELAGNETHAGGSHGGGSGRKHRVRLGSMEQFIIKN